MARRIAGDLLILIVTAFTVYLSAIMARRIRTVVLKDTYIEIFRYELMICAAFLILALDVRFGLLTKIRFTPVRIVGWTVRIVLICIAAAVLFFSGKIIAGSFIRSDEPAKNALVLGLALENGKPAGDLLLRVDTARDYVEKNPETTLILTGGNADGQGKTEAEVMRDLLSERGVPADRMILEDRAETTKQNFRNAAELMNPAEPTALITSNYHMDRAVQTAQNAGFTRIQRVPAPSSALHFGANVLWEVVLEVNELTLKKD